jgi:integrase
MGGTKRATATAAKQTTNGRRMWGAGSVSQREPGVWIVRLSHRRDPITGKRTREWRTVRGSRRDAERVLAELVRAQAAHGPTLATSASLTLDGWVRQHLASVDLSDRTRADQLKLWERHSTPALRARPLRDLTTALLTAHMAALREQVSEHTKRPLSPRTRQLYFNVVKAALSAAERQRMLPANPASGVEVKGGSGVSHAGSALTPEEMGKFLAHDPDDPLYPLWLAGATTGARPGELLGLFWDDLDFDAGTLTIRRALTDGPERPVFGPCKAGSARTVQIGDCPELLVALQRHRKRQLEARLRLGEKWIDPRLVFASEVGGALDRHNVSARFRRRCKAAGIRACRWYDLRHSVGSALIASGKDPKLVAETLGHRSVVTTLRHYTHPDASQQRAALGSLPWARATTATG